MKNFVFGDFNKNYRTGFIEDNNHLLKSLKILDYVEQYLNEGELKESIRLIENLNDNEKKIF